MGKKAKNKVSDDSKSIIDVCKELVKYSGIGIPEFLKKSGLTQTYWYTRANYEAPLSTSDIESIAKVFNLTSLDIYQRALIDTKIKIYEPQNIDEISDVQTDDVAEKKSNNIVAVKDYTELTRRIAPELLGMAANRDPNKYIESQTPTD